MRRPIDPYFRALITQREGSEKVDATVLKRQFITDAEGNPVGVILPLEEFALIEETLKQRLPSSDKVEKLAQMAHAANDALFMTDLRETMDAFDGTDAQWWEQAQ